MQPILEKDYKFLKEQAEKFDPKLSKILDDLIIFSAYLHKNNLCLIKIEPSEIYNLNEKVSTIIPDGNIKRHSQATIVLSISYPTESGLVKVGTCGLTYNRRTESMNLDYIQGQKGVKCNNPAALKFRLDLFRAVISCTYDQIKDNLFYPDILNKTLPKNLEKSVGYLRDRFFDKNGKLNIRKANVADAIKNRIVIHFSDFPSFKSPKPKIKKRIKVPRRSLKV